MKTQPEPLFHGHTPQPGAAAEALIEKLGRALHRYGSPAHRLEEAMDLVARRLGLDGEFFSTPTAIFAAFRPVAATDRTAQRTILLRVEPGEVNLEKLSRLDQILSRVVRGELAPSAAATEVDAIVDAEARYGNLLSIFAFAFASGSTARFFGGGLGDVAAAAAIGFVIGILAIVMGRFPNTGRLFEACAAALTGFLVSAAIITSGAISSYIVTAAALIVLVPGLTLTVAMTELATRHLVSGSARLAGALMMFMSIAVGFALGDHLGDLLGPAGPPFVPPSQPYWTELVALVFSAAALLVLFRAHPKDYGWFLIAGSVALGGSRFGATHFGPHLGALVGAVLIGVGSNLFARLRDRPAAILQMPGLMLLVPGSLGFKSVTSLLENDTLSGVQTAFTVAMVAISLATGLLIANALLAPKRAL